MTTNGYAFDFGGHGVFTPEGRADDIQPSEVERHNQQLERQELSQWATQPERWQVYVSEEFNQAGFRIVTTWLGTVLGMITRMTTYRNNFGSRIVAITFKATNGATYYGRYGADWSQLCRVRKAKSS